MCVLLDTVISNVTMDSSCEPHRSLVVVSSAGKTQIDETFVAGFMLVDKLGLSAELGLSLVVRQTFYGFWFALVDESFEPRPNYWLSLAFKRLVGREVLQVQVRHQFVMLKQPAGTAVPSFSVLSTTFLAAIVISVSVSWLSLNLPENHTRLVPKKYDHTIYV